MSMRIRPEHARPWPRFAGDRHPPHPSPRPPFGDRAELRDRLEWWLVRGPSVALFFLAIAILSLFPLLIRALFRP